MKVRFKINNRGVITEYEGYRYDNKTHGFIYCVLDTHYYAESQVSSWEEI